MPVVTVQMRKGRSKDAKRALMRNVTDAQLYLDVGGDENDPRNPAPLQVTRGQDDPERFAFIAVLPSVENALPLISLPAWISERNVERSLRIRA